MAHVRRRGEQHRLLAVVDAAEAVDVGLVAIGDGVVDEERPLVGGLLVDAEADEAALAIHDRFDVEQDLLLPGGQVVPGDVAGIVPEVPDGAVRQEREVDGALEAGEDRLRLAHARRCDHQDGEGGRAEDAGGGGSQGTDRRCATRGNGRHGRPSESCV